MSERRDFKPSNEEQAFMQAGVRNLRKYGYPSVTEDNILTDAIYSAFFLSMLKDNLGKGHDPEINRLIKECEASS